MRRSKRTSDSGDPWQAPDPALALALQQMNWFARHRNRARLTYQINEILILFTTATTTVTAALKVSASATAILAASTVVLAGLYKVLDAHGNWLAFSSAWAELHALINEYRMLPADERDDDAQRTLIGKVNDVNTAETGRWVSRRQSLVAGG
ncbi:MAG TPA: SLATT domain-containing protein [Streptosporangiaceae bacterium]|nr:SLATT domain-containing protein [Streptosporangiaceae bacterium]